MKHLCSMPVPHLLIREQMEFRRQLAEENLKKPQDRDYMYCCRVITIDKSRIHHYDPKLKCESEIYSPEEEQKQ